MSFSRQIFFWIAIILSFASVQAQYRFDHITADNGLPQNSAYSIAQTSDGYIWMTTLDGLVRYDGVRFTVFNKSNSKNFTSNRLINMTVGSDDSLWLINEGGFLSRYRGGEFQNFTTDDGLPNSIVHKVIEEPGGKILVFPPEGPAQFAGSRFEKSPGDWNNDVSIYYSSAGTTWEMRSQTLKRVKNGQETTFTLPVAVNEVAPTGYWFINLVRMFEDREGRLWFYLDEYGSGSDGGRSKLSRVV